MKSLKVFSFIVLLCPVFLSSCVNEHDLTDVSDILENMEYCEAKYRSRRIDHHSKRNDIITQVQQRFYKFQDATSALKQLGHNPNTALLQTALDVFISFIDPAFINYEFITISNFQFHTLQEIRDAYQFFATQIFNSFSQHFSTNIVVDPVAGTDCRQALMTAGGGEWASLYSVAGDPTNANEQLTISNWEIQWVYLEDGPTGADWYIHSYKEFGDRLFRFCPASGPLTLLFARQFPGSTQEPTIDVQCINNPPEKASEQKGLDRKNVKK